MKTTTITLIDSKSDSLIKEYLAAMPAKSKAGEVFQVGSSETYCQHYYSGKDKKMGVKLFEPVYVEGILDCHRIVYLQPGGKIDRSSKRVDLFMPGGESKETNKVVAFPDKKQSTKTAKPAKQPAKQPVSSLESAYKLWVQELVEGDRLAEILSYENWREAEGKELLNDRYAFFVQEHLDQERYDQIIPLAAWLVING